jgi:hypothetical protein
MKIEEGELLEREQSRQSHRPEWDEEVVVEGFDELEGEPRIYDSTAVGGLERPSPLRPMFVLHRW